MGRLEKLCTGASYWLILIGCAVLFGWWQDLPYLRSGWPGLPATNPITACCVILCGVALVLLKHRKDCPACRLIVRTCGVGVAFVAAAKLASGWTTFKVDELLFTHGVRTVEYGHMANATAIAVVLFGAALILCDLGSRWSLSASLLLNSAGALVAIFVVTSFASYAANPLLSQPHVAMSLVSATCLLVMSFNLYFEIAKRGTAPFLVGKSLGDLLFRRLAVVALIGPVGVGMMTLTAEHLGYVQGTTGVSLQITAIVTVFFIALSRVAKVLEESESQRNEAQNDLEQQEHFLTTVINSIPSFIFIKNADGQFLLANKATADVYGTTLDELIGKRDADFCSDPEQVQNFIEKDREALRTHDKVLILQESITDSTGEMRWLQTVKVPISSPTGELQVLGVSTDITEIKKIEQELLRSQSQLREAHEELEAQNFSLERMIRDRTLDLEQAQMEMLRRLATAAEFRDDDTGEHTSRVSELSGLIAEGLGLPQRQVEMIRSAAALHDLGKIGISDTLFLKPGKLTVEEFEIMKSHTIIAGKILGGSPSPLLQLAEKIAMAHHEKWDGSGYPNGLRSDEIPHEARIVAVADVFDALTHARPYKDAWPKEAALDEIQRLSGSHLDPEVVQIFVSLMAEEELDLRKAA